MKTHDIVAKSEYQVHLFILLFMQSLPIDKDFLSSIQFLHGSLKIVPAKL